MRAHRYISLCLIVLSPFSCARAGVKSNEPRPAPVDARLIVIAREQPVQQEKILLELVRSRFPVVVLHGRFNTDDGVTNTCIYARRSSGRGEPSPASKEELPYCPMIGAYHDGVRISDAGALLASVRGIDYASVELLSASDAMQRYGFSAVGSDVLVLWTRGRGPYAAREF